MCRLFPRRGCLVGRGIKTLALRVAHQNAAGLAVARALEAHPRVQRVYYPLLESHPDYAVAKTQLAGGGGVVSFTLHGGREAAGRFVDALRLATIAPSLGGVETLVEQPALMSYHELSDAELAAVGVEPAVRLAIGIEEISDIWRTSSRRCRSSSLIWGTSRGNLSSSGPPCVRPGHR